MVEMMVIRPRVGVVAGFFARSGETAWGVTLGWVFRSGGDSSRVSCRTAVRCEPTRRMVFGLYGRPEPLRSGASPRAGRRRIARVVPFGGRRPRPHGSGREAALAVERVRFERAASFGMWPSFGSSVGCCASHLGGFGFWGAGASPWAWTALLRGIAGRRVRRGDQAAGVSGFERGVAFGLRPTPMLSNGLP